MDTPYLTVIAQDNMKNKPIRNYSSFVQTNAYVVNKHHYVF